MSVCRRLACLLLFLGTLPAGLAAADPGVVQAAPVPEPATLLLAGGGLLAIAAHMRRRKRPGGGGGSV